MMVGLNQTEFPEIVNSGSSWILGFFLGLR